MIDIESDFDKARALLVERGGGVIVLGDDGVLYVAPFVGGKLTERQVRRLCAATGIDADALFARMTKVETP